MEAALSTLTEKELAVIELVVIGGMSLTVAGGWLGAEYGRKPWSKQAVANIRDGALKKMRVYYESV
jgi:cytochrome bd-type quinol oxidase subunit 1